jgi:hypothetical protein
MSDKEIDVEDDSIVEVDLDNKGPVDVQPENKVDDSVVEVKTEENKKPKEPRITQTKSELNEATQALQQALNAAENARKSAEAQAHAEHRRAEDALRLVHQRSEEVKTYQAQSEDRQTAIINNGIEAAKRELEASTQEQQRAWEAGEFDKATAAGARVAKAAAALDRYETSKVDHENRLKQAPQRQAEQPYSGGGSTFDNYVSTMAPRAQAWMRLHPECAPPQVGGDYTSHHKAMAGHNLALSKGIQEGSDDYFKIIEESTGYRTPVVPNVQSTASTVVQATGGESPVNRQQSVRAPVPAAPVSRDVPSNSGVLSPNKVKLSPQQQEIALISTSQRQGEAEDSYRKRAFSQYASELIKATQEGKIGRLTH